MQLSASSPSSDPLAALLGAPAQAPSAPAGAVAEFSQLVAEFTAGPAGVATDAAAAAPESAPLPAGALWQSLYSNPARGADGNLSPGPAIGRPPEGASATASTPEPGLTAPASPETSRRKLLGGGRGARAEARSAAPLERERKGPSAQPAVECVVGPVPPEGIIGPLAAAMLGASLDSPTRPTSESDVGSAAEAAGAGGSISGQVQDNLPAAAGVSGSIAGGRLGVGGVPTRLGRLSGRSTPQVVSTGIAAERSAGPAEFTRPVATQRGEARLARLSAGVPAVPDSARGGPVDGNAVPSFGLAPGSERGGARAEPLNLTRSAGTENEGQSVGLPMPQNLGDSAAPFQREVPTDGEAFRRVEPMILPADRVRVGPGTFSRSDLPPPIEAGASTEHGAPVSDEALPADRVGIGPGTFSRSDLPPPTEVSASTEHGAPVSGEALPAVANELGSQTGVAALSSASDKVRAGELAPAEEDAPRDDWAFGARRFTRFLSGEKSADRGGEEGNRFEVLIKASRKDFQNVTGEGHENGISSVGTDSAISAQTMTSSAFLPRLETATPAVLAASLPNGQTLEFGSAELNETNVPAEVAGTAQRAVTAVLERVESAATREQHTVSLKFAMGETPLRVSVEWRAEEVRTTFHTDSAELRAALAQEWQAVAAKSPERFDRFETPVFTSGSPGSSGPGSSASDGFARQSQTHSQSAGQESAGYRTARGHLLPVTDGADAAPSSSPDLTPLTSRHLHTHA